MNCGRCGYENREGARYCQACGAPLQSSQGPGYNNPGYYYAPYQGNPYVGQPQFVEHKDVVVALLLALMVPGVGHMYAGEVKKGVLILATFIIIGTLVLLAGVAAAGSFVSSQNPFPIAVVIVLVVIISLVIWLYQIYDAYQAALRYNASRGLSRF